MKYTMSNYKIVNNIFSEKSVNDLYNMLNDEYFPWYFTPSIFNKNLEQPNNKRITYSPGFYHTVKHTNLGVNSNENVINNVMPILREFCDYENLKLKEVLRIRIRKTLQYPNHINENYNVPHIDLQGYLGKYYSLIYYPEDSDGDTVLFNSKKDVDGDMTHLDIINNIEDEIIRVSPKKGRAVFFKGDIVHSGNNPINYQKRIVVNYDFSLE